MKILMKCSQCFVWYTPKHMTLIDVQINNLHEKLLDSDYESIDEGEIRRYHACARCAKYMKRMLRHAQENQNQNQNDQ